MSIKRFAYFVPMCFVPMCFVPKSHTRKVKLMGRVECFQRDGECKHGSYSASSVFLLNVDVQWHLLS